MNGQTQLPLLAAGMHNPFILRVYSAHDCPTCEAIGSGIGPPHDASPQCESGGHQHCSCDRCF